MNDDNTMETINGVYMAVEPKRGRIVLQTGDSRVFAALVFLIRFLLDRLGGADA